MTRVYDIPIDRWLTAVLTPLHPLTHNSQDMHARASVGFYVAVHIVLFSAITAWTLGAPRNGVMGYALLLELAAFNILMMSMVDYATEAFDHRPSELAALIICTQWFVLSGHVYKWGSK